MLFRGYQNYKSMNIIIDQTDQTGALWLGDYTAATNQSLLKQKNIKTVLTVASFLNVKYPSNSDIIHKVYNIQDIESCNIKRIWPDTFQQIEEGLQRGSVLVHCAAGVSRSASTVIAYIMRKQNMNFTEAFQFVRLKRSVICPNFGFQRQLRQFEKELQGGGCNQINNDSNLKNEIQKNQNQTKTTLPSQTPPLANLSLVSNGISLTEKKQTNYRRQQLTPAAKLPKPQINYKQFSTVKK